MPIKFTGNIGHSGRCSSKMTLEDAHNLPEGIQIECDVCIVPFLDDEPSTASRIQVHLRESATFCSEDTWELIRIDDGEWTYTGSCTGDPYTITVTQSGDTWSIAFDTGVCMFTGSGLISEPIEITGSCPPTSYSVQLSEI